MRGRMTTSMRARGILIFVEMMDGFAMQSSRRLELYRNGIQYQGRQLPFAGDRADLPDGMSKTREMCKTLRIQMNDLPELSSDLAI